MATRGKKDGGQKAVSYLRCSGLGQVGGDTWDRQQAAITKYAKAHGLQLVDEFRDAGVSGTKDLENRPGLAALLDRVESNGVRIVLVETSSRLARDLMVSEVILQQLADAGCTVIAADSGTELTGDTDDPTRRLIRQVLGAVDQFEKSVTVLKLRAARDRGSRKAGRRIEGRKPFGSRPGEAAAVARIRELHRKPVGRERRSLQEICDILNAENVPTRMGTRWTRQVLHKIVRRGLPAAE
jgi:DNA invertase Pin-like site-specific DNA recombinase